MPLAGDALARGCGVGLFSPWRNLARRIQESWRRGDFVEARQGGDERKLTGEEARAHVDIRHGFGQCGNGRKRGLNDSIRESMAARRGRAVLDMADVAFAKCRGDGSFLTEQIEQAINKSRWFARPIAMASGRGE